MAGQTIYDLVTLENAVKSTRVLPGDTLLLRAGVYNSDYISELNGTALNKITIKPYNNEKVVFTGNVTIKGSYQIWEGFEFKSESWSKRISDSDTVPPPDITGFKNFVLEGNANTIRGCILHDLYSPSFLTASINGKIEDSLIYNIGWNAPGRGHGHGIYIQNTPDFIKKMDNCVIINTFGLGIHAYTQSGSIDNILLNKIVSCNIGALSNNKYASLIGGYVPANNIDVQDCLFYNSLLQLGYADPVLNSILKNNYSPDGIVVYSGSTFTESTGNVITKPTSGIVQFCNKFSYKDTSGILTIYNWDLAGSVVANLSSITGIYEGDTVRLRSIEDYFNCYQDLVVDSNLSISVNMASLGKTVATAQGHNYTPPTNFPEFGCFFIEKITQ